MMGLSRWCGSVIRMPLLVSAIARSRNRRVASAAMARALSSLARWYSAWSRPDVHRRKPSSGSTINAPARARFCRTVRIHDLILDLPRRSALHLKGVDRRRGDIFHAGQSDLGKDRPAEFLLRIQNRTGESDDRNPTGILGHLHILDVDAALLADNPEQMGPAHVLAHTCGIGRGDDPAVSIDDRKPTIDLIVLAHPI